MISETNDFRNDINKNNINDLLGVVVSYVVVQFFILCFVSLYLPRSCLVLVAYKKTNILCLFLFNAEIIHRW